MKIGLIQMDVVDDKKENIKKAKDMILEAHDQGAEIIMLPEMFNTPYQNDKFSSYAETETGETVEFIKSTAKELKILLIGGSIPEKSDGKIYNTCFIANESGKIIGKHRKIHLFDIDVKDGITFFESDTLSPGESTTVIDTSFGKIGIAICYDIRFPELFRKMVLEGAKYFFIPAAFNTVTGPAHWEILTRTRALDNQVFLAIVSPARSEILKYKAYGHSLVTSPWGAVLSELDEKESVLIVDINSEEIDRIREELPVLKHRKSNIY
ncbi:MAG: carbon-nitrogen hydrolase family protein [Clostridiales bacterium]|nr:carbon-nitrogen hydrolase family protein [Clostridiales bacterium]